MPTTRYPRGPNWQADSSSVRESAVSYFNSAKIPFLFLFRLALGSTYFDVTMGTRGGFLQQLVSIRANDSVPSLVVLGQLSHRVICTPDLESLTNSVDSLS